MFPAKKYYIFTNIPGSSESPKMKIFPNFQKHSHQSPFFDKFSNLTAKKIFFHFFSERPSDGPMRHVDLRVVCEQAIERLDVLWH